MIDQSEAPETVKRVEGGKLDAMLGYCESAQCRRQRDPAQVGRMGAAFIRGLRRGGVLATAKHFPGHGATSADSHDAVPAVADGIDLLMARDVAPYAAAFAAGANGGGKRLLDVLAGTDQHLDGIAVDDDRIVRLDPRQRVRDLADDRNIQRARDHRGPKVDFQLLIYPATDQRAAHPSVTRNGEGYLLTKKSIEYFRAHYLPNPKDYLDWRASPLLARSLAGLPPAVVNWPPAYKLLPDTASTFT